MRLAAVAAAASLAVIAPGDRATATYASGTLSLRLHYAMVCGEPGRGPVVVRLPAAFRVARLRARVRGEVRPFSVAGTTVTIDLAKPPQITCMSITEGMLAVVLSGVRAPTGTYVVRASVDAHSFAASLRVP